MRGQQVRKRVDRNVHAPRAVHDARHTRDPKHLQQQPTRQLRHTHLLPVTHRFAHFGPHPRRAAPLGHPVLRRLDHVRPVRFQQPQLVRPVHQPAAALPAGSLSPLHSHADVVSSPPGRNRKQNHHTAPSRLLHSHGGRLVCCSSGRLARSPGRLVRFSLHLVHPHTDVPNRQAAARPAQHQHVLRTNRRVLQRALQKALHTRARHGYDPDLHRSPAAGRPSPPPCPVLAPVTEVSSPSTPRPHRARRSPRGHAKGGAP